MTGVIPGKSVDSGWSTTSSQPQSRRFAGRFQQARDVRAERHDFVRPAPQSVRALELPIAVHERGHQGCRRHPHERHTRQHGQPLAASHEPQQPENDEHRQVEQVIAARQCLHDPGCGEQHEPARAPIPKIQVKRREGERHPVRRKDLDVRELRHPVRRKPEREAGDERAVVAARNRVGQEVRRQRAENERKKEHRVVGEQRIAAHEDHGRRDDRQAEQVLGKRHRPIEWKELRGVPPGRRQRRHAGIPRHQPGVEQRIAEVVGHDAARVQRQGPCDRNGEDDVETCGGGNGDGGAHE